MIRATLRMQVIPGRDDDFVGAWEKIAAAAATTDGNLGQCLLRGQPGEFVITSDWASREAFSAFERSPEQDALTAGLRELRRSVRMDIAEIVAHVESETPPRSSRRMAR
jgi:heme-degrading monooxygenase HmoA